MLFGYFISMYTNFHFIIRCFFSLLAGFFHYLSMVHLWHDGGHYSYSRYPVIWKYFGYLGEITTGHSMYMWIHRHNVSHHIYTNVSGIDPDIGIYKASPNKPLEGFNYRQKVSVVPSWLQPYLYLVVVMQMQIDDFFSYKRGAMEQIKINDQGFIKSFVFYGAKIFFLIHRIILPIILGQTILQTLILFILCEFVAGLLFGYFSQVSHVQSEVQWPNDSPIQRDWAELQVETAVDFAHDSFFLDIC